MTGILAIETATDACSLALIRRGQLSERHRVAPREHNRLLFTMLSELLPDGKLVDQGIEAIAYGCGPGSFTGLRIAASAAQGLAYSSTLPAIPVSTLACMAQSALRLGLSSSADRVLCVLDARIDEVYAAVFCYRDGLAVPDEGPWACSPAELSPSGSYSLCGVGNGFLLSGRFAPSLRARISSSHAQLMPHARDLIPLALAAYQRGDIQSPGNVQPVYLREEIGWKKLGQQQGWT